MSWVAAIGGIVAVGTTAYQAKTSADEKRRAERAARKALAEAPKYGPTQASRNMLAEAQANRNAVNPAVQLAYQQAQQGAANQSALAQRNATSGAEALAVGSAAQGNLQSLLPQIAAQQTSYDMNNRAQYNSALSNMSDEERLAFQSQRDRNSDEFNFNLGLAGAANANKNQAIMNGVGALSQAGLSIYDRRYNWPKSANSTAANTQTPYNSMLTGYMNKNGYYAPYWGVDQRQNYQFGKNGY